MLGGSVDLSSPVRCNHATKSNAHFFATLSWIRFLMTRVILTLSGIIYGSHTVYARCPRVLRYMEPVSAPYSVCYTVEIIFWKAQSDYRD